MGLGGVGWGGGGRSRDTTAVSGSRLTPLTLFFFALPSAQVCGLCAPAQALHTDPAAGPAFAIVILAFSAGLVGMGLSRGRGVDEGFSCRGTLLWIVLNDLHFFCLRGWRSEGRGRDKNGASDWPVDKNGASDWPVTGQRWPESAAAGSRHAALQQAFDHMGHAFDTVMSKI